MLSFNVTAEYENIDIIDWNSNPFHLDYYKNAFINNVEGLRESYITDVIIRDVSSRRTLLMLSTRFLTTKKLLITMVLSLNPDRINPTSSAYDVFITLKNSIDSSNTAILSELQSQSTYFQTVTISTITYSDYEVVFLHSAYPSSTPTSRPTCGTGSYQVDNNCGYCFAGYFTDTLNAISCTACPIGTYNTRASSTACSPCPVFTSNIVEASTSCPQFTIAASAFTYHGIASFIAVLFLFSLLYAGKDVYIFFVLGLFPFLDIVTDIIYLLSVKFYSFRLFIACMVFIILPSSMFLYHLYSFGITPVTTQFIGTKVLNGPLVWLGFSNGYPTINSQRSQWLNDANVGLERSVRYWLLWICLTVLQLVYLVVAIIWYALSSLFLFFWLIVGIFLYQTKVLAIGNVWNMWVRLYTQSNDFDKQVSLDVSLLHQSLFFEFIIEAVPQITIQAINNSLTFTGHYPAISLLSVVTSSLIVIHGLYRYGYYRLWKGILFDEIPLPLDVKIQGTVDKPPRHKSVSALQRMMSVMVSGSSKAQVVPFSEKPRNLTNEIKQNLDRIRSDLNALRLDARPVVDCDLLEELKRFNNFSVDFLSMSGNPNEDDYKNIDESLAIDIKAEETRLAEFSVVSPNTNYVTEDGDAKILPHATTEKLAFQSLPQIVNTADNNIATRKNTTIIHTGDDSDSLSMPSAKQGQLNAYLTDDTNKQDGSVDKSNVSNKNNAFQMASGKGYSSKVYPLSAATDNKEPSLYKVDTTAGSSHQYSGKYSNSSYYGSANVPKMATRYDQVKVHPSTADATAVAIGDSKPDYSSQGIGRPNAVIIGPNINPSSYNYSNNVTPAATKEITNTNKIADTKERKLPPVEVPTRKALDDPLGLFSLPAAKEKDPLGLFSLPAAKEKKRKGGKL